MQRISDQNLTRLSPKIISENAVKSILADITHFARALKYLICRFIKSLPAVKHSFRGVLVMSNFDPKSVAFLVYFIIKGDHFG